MFTLCASAFGAEDLRISLLQVDGVGKVVFAGEQQEVIYLEIERDRIAALGVSLNSLYQALATQNIVAPAGSIKLADTRVEVTPTNELDSVRAIEELLVPTQGSSSIVRVKDIATVKRQYREPQSETKSCWAGWHQRHKSWLAYHSAW